MPREALESVVEIVRGAGHIPHQERPVEFNAALHSVLDRIRRYDLLVAGQFGDTLTYT